MTDLLSGTVQLGFLDLSIAMPQIRAGKLKVLATTGEHRTPLLPEVPTIAESGFPGYAIGVWFAMFAPAKTPRDIVESLSKTTAAVLQDPVLMAKMQEIGQTLQFSTPDQLGDFLKSETHRLSIFVKDARVTAD